MTPGRRVFLIAAVVTIALLPCGPSTPAMASDFAGLYDDATLQYWQSRYHKGLAGNLQEVIMPRLTAQERQVLAGVRLDLPLRVPDQEPFAFYSSGPPYVVTMSAQSLKFFDDYCVAVAWLQANGYSIETAAEYVSMLKYRDPAALGGRYPLMLDALAIPGNALDDPHVNDIANRIFNEAIFFVLVHELGHILYRHPGYGPDVPRAVARANEAEADAFALDMMRRVEAEPLGMTFFYLMSAHGLPGRGDFGSDADYARFLDEATHPLTSDRMATLADSIERGADVYARNESDPAASRERLAYIVSQLREVAAILGDVEVQALIAHRGRSTTPDMLAPRRSGALPAPAATGGGADLTERAPFDGTFDGAFSDGTAALPMRTILRRNGNQVTGEYYYGGGSGRIVGLIEGQTLYYQWLEGGASGYGYLELDADGRSVAGRWGHGESMDDGGTWSGARVE